MTLNVCHFGFIADFGSCSKTLSLGDGVHFNDLGNYKLWRSVKGTVFVPESPGSACTDNGPIIN